MRFTPRLRTRVLPSSCKMLLLLLIGNLFSSPAGAQVTDLNKPRPNVLFVFADDWGRQAGAYATIAPGGLSDVVSTPNFDRIAKQGVLFTQAYVSAPSCTPCRSSLFSGRNFWETGRGAILRGAVWDERIPTFPLLLKEQGYHIGFSGKVWSPGRPQDAPFGGTEHRYNQHGGRFNGFSQFLNKHQESVESAKEKLLREVQQNFGDFLSDRNQDQPFLYYWGPTNIHRKWVAGSGQKFWGIDPDRLQGKVPPFMPDISAVREDLADYLGEVQALDLGLGQLVKDLEQAGELENTVIIISGDHGAAGFPNGKCSLYDFGTRVPLAIWLPSAANGGRVVTDLVSLPDLAPTILELCGAEVPTGMSSKSLVNILESEREGRVDHRREFVVTGRERHVDSARVGNLPYPQRAIRSQDFLLIHNFEPERWPMGTGPGWGTDEDQLPAFEKLRENTHVAWSDFDASPTKAWIAHRCRTPESKKYFDFAFGRRPEWELYSVADDPHQLNNLADDPKFSAQRAQLEKKLMDYQLLHRDPRVMGDGKTFEKPPFVKR